MARNKNEKKEKWRFQRRREKAVMAVLLSILLLFQTGTAFAVNGTANRNEATEEDTTATVSENQPAENESDENGETEADTEPDEDSGENPDDDGESGLEEDATEGTVSGQDILEIQAGATTGPANPVHHCTKKSDGSDYTDFSYVYFGSYPQSEVTDSATIAAIDKAIAISGVAAEAGTDVWVNGGKYRRISKSDTNYNKYFDDVPNNNGYRYFKWERMKWKVLQNDGKTLFVVADRAIDCKNYNETVKKVTWETSTIRNWLNTSFYNTAFSSSERGAIAAQTVVNEDNPENGTEGGNNTNDNVYFLSIGEVTDERFGFCSDYSIYSASRRIKASDYAHARGGEISNNSNYTGNCWWWLRSPGNDNGSAAYVQSYGYIGWYKNFVVAPFEGICPALHINLSSALWLTADDGTSGEGGDEKIEEPTASLPVGSRVSQNTKLRLSCATGGASIYYTTDGTTPTTASARYSGEITIDRDMMIKAVAVRDSRPSAVETFTYRIKKTGNQPENPLHACTQKDDGTDATDFSYIYFGSYPQSEVTDSATIAAIEKAASTSGTQAEAGIDVWVKGIKYRRISKKDTTYDGYFDKVANKGYRYFKWERIKWRVLENDGKTLIVAADNAIDCKRFNEKLENNIWETSTMRSWLNSDFYNAAFSSIEKSAVMKHTAINDKIYLLSAEEATEWKYGFCGNYDCKSQSRMMKASSYANARGASANGSGNGYWWLRSQGGISKDVMLVDCEGWIHRGGDNVHTEHDGVCPAMRINLSSVLWSATDDGTSGEGGEEKIPVSLQATKGKTVYYIGEPLNVDDLKVTASYQRHPAEELKPGEYTTNVSKINMDTSGNKTLTVSYTSGGATCTASVTITVESIKKLSLKGPSKKLAAGKKVKLTLKTTPKGVSAGAVEWKSSNKKYATVNKNGTITIKKAGAGKNVTITATARGDSKVKAAYRFKIMKHAVKSIKLKAPKKTLKTGKSMIIKATVKTTGKNANKTLKWTSSNKKYATVNSKGKVTAKKAGKGKTVTITAKSTDGSNKKAAVKVQIK